MTRQEAKKVLLRYRPGSTDEADPEVRCALKQVSQDPQLAAWLDDHRTFQQEVREGLRSVEVPSGLREQILSERKVRLSPWRSPRRLVFSALAAAVVALALFGWWIPRSDTEARFATYRSRMVKAVLRGYAMDIETRDITEIRAYLRKERAAADWISPPGLETTPLLGCAVLTWRSQPASMICYGRGSQPELWLFVADSSAFPDPPDGPGPTVEKVNRLNTVSWSQRGRTYLLAGDLDEAGLLRLLQPRS